MARHLRFQMKFAVALSLIALASLSSSCLADAQESPGRWFDDQHRLSQRPPEARTVCEKVFFDRLLTGINPSATAIPSPNDEALVAVYRACSPGELLAADERFAYSVGPSEGMLVSRRLFNGPVTPISQLENACEDPALAPTTACRYTSVP
jgi:hypothetical protein